MKMPALMANGTLKIDQVPGETDSRLPGASIFSLELCVRSFLYFFFLAKNYLDADAHSTSIV